MSKTFTVTSLSIQLIRVVHYGVLLFVVLGWLAGSAVLLIAHLFTIPLVILQWKLNQGRCLLTDLEQKLSPVPTEQESEGFVKKLLQSVFKIKTTDEQVLIFMYAVMGTSFLISAVKLFTL